MAGRPLVVVADRVASTCELLRMVFEEEFRAYVTAVGGGAELLAVLREARPQLIVFEVADRPEDADVLQQIRADPDAAGVPLLCLTMTDMRGWGCGAVRRLGADACIEKPFDLGQLIDRARELLERWAVVAPTDPRARQVRSLGRGPEP